MTISNNVAVTGWENVESDRVLNMEVFDTLPRVVRDLLNTEMVVSIDPFSVVDGLRECGTSEALARLRANNVVLRRQMRADMLAMIGCQQEEAA